MFQSGRATKACPESDTYFRGNKYLSAGSFSGQPSLRRFMAGEIVESYVCRFMEVLRSSIE